MVAGLERTGCAHCTLESTRFASRRLCIVGRVLRLEPHIARRGVYADGRGPLETRMVIVAPAAALDGVWPITFPVATLSS